MIKSIDGNPGSVQMIYELGSGTGSLSCAISRQMNSATVIACENSPIPYAFSVIRAKLTRCQNLILQRESFDQLDITPAELIICYLSTEIMVNLSSKFKKELRSGSFIISHTFAYQSGHQKRLFMLMTSIEPLFTFIASNDFSRYMIEGISQ